MYRAYHGKSKDLLLASPQILNEILPFDLIKEQKYKDWIKQIEKAFNKQSKLDRDDAMIEFLKETFKLPTFGSTFFEVKQTTDQNYPELVLVAINKNGVSLIHRQTKVGEPMKICFFHILLLNRIYDTSRISWSLSHSVRYPTGQAVTLTSTSLSVKNYHIRI